MVQSSHGAPDDAPRSYDAVLYLSFGGPEGPDDVMPFLENVTRGRGVPRPRLEEVARHYHRFGGVSPINAQNRAVIAALRRELARNGPDLPVYWGNRNWKPYLADTMREMRDDRVRRAICFVTSPYSSYSGCRQYREDIAAAQASTGPDAPVIDKLRVFYNHPGFVGPMTDHVRTALQAVPASRRAGTRLAFSAHSIPTAMAETSSYAQQLGEAARLVVAGLEGEYPWELVYQSRSGPPHVPWLEPDVSEHLEKLHARGVRDVVVVPLGFVSDHLEVRFDLDVEAAGTARRLGLHMVRTESVGAHPAYVRMIRDLIVERTRERPERPALGSRPAGHDICAADCCPAREPRPAAAQLPG
ncbi:MAG: ferrochelatase [Actinomycetota bacterium]